METEDMPSVRKAHQTAFERSLARRIEKAELVFELGVTLKEYTSNISIESLAVLKENLERFRALNDRFADEVENYMEVSLRRKHLFKGQSGSIKQIAYSIKIALSKDKSLRKLYVQEVKGLYAAIFAQNPLSPPYDFAHPTFEKDFEAFLLSYATLQEHFKALVEKVGEHKPALTAFSISIMDCENIIAQAEFLGREIDGLVQKVFVTNEERLLVFELIKEGCNAVHNRCRHLVGANHPVYKEINSLKYAIM